MKKIPRINTDILIPDVVVFMNAGFLGAGLGYYLAKWLMR